MIRLQVFSLAFLALGSQGLAQSTWYVDTNAAPGGNGTQQAPYDTIQGGISQASTLSGDTLLVLPGDYLESIDYLGKNLILRSTAGSATTTIDGQGGSTVSLVNGESAAQLDGFTVRGGTGTLVGPDSFGGGIYGPGSSFTVANCEILSNEANFGGGIFTNGGGAVSILSTTIDGNRARIGAGMHTENVSVLIDNCTLLNNWVNQLATILPSNEGGGLWAGPSGSLTVLDSTFRFNRAPTNNNNPAPEGGAVYTETPNAFFRGCLFSNNMTGGDFYVGWARGGGVYCDGPLGSLPVFEDCTFKSNRAELGRGGAIYGRGLFSDCTVTSNSALYGGGVQATTGLTMINSTLSGNSAVALSECVGDGGGALYGMYINCVISSNFAYITGGGAHQATLTDCTIRLNKVGSNSCPQLIKGGGGISESTATNCLIEQNQIEASEAHTFTDAGGGGALSSTLIQCEILNNTVSIPYNDWMQTVSGFGGGAYNSQLTDCLVQGNLLEVYGDSGAHGGGIYGGSATNCEILDNRVVRLDPNSSWPSLGGGAANTDLTRCTLVGNQAGSGGAFWQGSMTNCSVAANTATAGGGAVSAMSEESGGQGVLVAVHNSILWGNSPDEVLPGSGVVNITYSDVAGGVLPGLGNISTPPLFWNFPLGDVQLLAASPCIDTGDPTSPPDGDGSVVDMGALPYDANYEGAPAIYCTAKINSLYCLPSIGFSGTPSVGGPDDFFLAASNLVNEKPTMAIWSRYPAAIPFMGGTLCLAPPIQRTSVMDSGGTFVLPDCTGTASFRFSQGYMASKSVVAGDGIYVQFWQRDPAQLDGTGTGLTDAVGFTVVP